MIAIPVKKDSISGNFMSDLYGNAEFFAFCSENGKIEVKKNEAQGSGVPTAQYIIDSGSKFTLETHMGKGLFEKLNSADVSVYFVKQKDLKLEDVLDLFEKGNFPKVTPENADELLDPGGAGACTCGCDNK